MEREVQRGCHGFYPYSLVSQEDTEVYLNLFSQCFLLMG